MYHRNNLDNLKTELRARADYYTAAAEKWKTVTIKKTKSGAEYKKIGAAIENAYIYKMFSWSEPELCAHIDYRDNKYCAHLLPMIRKNEDGTRRETTAEELRESIAERVQYCESEAEKYKKSLEIVDKIYNDYYTAINAATEKLYKDTEECPGLAFLITTH